MKVSFEQADIPKTDLTLLLGGLPGRICFHSQCARVFSQIWFALKFMTHALFSVALQRLYFFPYLILEHIKTTLD